MRHFEGGSGEEAAAAPPPQRPAFADASASGRFHAQLLVPGSEEAQAFDDPGAFCDALDECAKNCTIVTYSSHQWPRSVKPLSWKSWIDLGYAIECRKRFGIAHTSLILPDDAPQDAGACRIKAVYEAAVRDGVLKWTTRSGRTGCVYTNWFQLARTQQIISKPSFLESADPPPMHMWMRHWRMVTGKA